MLPLALCPARAPHLVEGQVAELDVEGARNMLQVGVVADDQRDVALQLACKAWRTPDHIGISQSPVETQDDMSAPSCTRL